MCKRIPEYPDYGDGVNADEPFCYVHQPSSCPDLKQSEVYNMIGEKYSSFACKQNQGKWIDSQILAMFVILVFVNHYFRRWLYFCVTFFHFMFILKRRFLNAISKLVMI